MLCVVVVEVKSLCIAAAAALHSLLAGACRGLEVRHWDHLCSPGPTVMVDDLCLAVNKRLEA